MQDRRAQRLIIDPYGIAKSGENRRDRHRVGDVRITAQAQLALMAPGRDITGPLDQLSIDARAPTNRTEFHLADTAAMHLGAAAFSVYNTLAAEQISHVLGNAGCRVVVCEEQFAARLFEASRGTAVEQVVCVDGQPAGTLTLEAVVAAGDPGFGFEDCWRAVAPGDLLTLIYTPGTTGPPKGVEITHAQMLAELAALTEFMAANGLPPAGPGDRGISCLPMAHVGDRMGGHYWPMFTGAQVAPLAGMTALAGALADVRPTLFGGVPRVWEKLKAGIEAMAAGESDPARRQAVQQALQIGLEYAGAALAGPVPAGLAGTWRQADEQVLSKIRAALGLDQVRLAVSGAAPIAPQVLQFMLGLGIPVTEGWGCRSAPASRRSTRRARSGSAPSARRCPACGSSSPGTVSCCWPARS